MKMEKKILTIKKISHEACTGCSACMNICPTDAIRMEYDAEGFLFPIINDNCICCGKCLNICPVQNQLPLHKTPASYAVWANDEIRLKSSSGGMFTLLAEEILNRGGIVFGAAYSKDFQYVYHMWVDKTDGLQALRSSKYVQSEIGFAFRDVKAFLNAGKTVLFSGCPCQIAGLYAYLGKDYGNLYTVDLICHGANSVSAYQSFLKEFSEGKDIKQVDFRDKHFFPWSTSLIIHFKDNTYKKSGFKDVRWYNAFLEGIVNRKCCYNCPYACAERISDLTLGDCWQVSRINPDYDDHKGTSLVLVNSDKGSVIFSSLKAKMQLCEKISLEEIRKYNGQLNNPTKENPSRKYFFSHLKNDGFHKSLWYGRNMRFDVGIVGWWFSSNYGSCLTYYALGSILNDLNKQIILISLPTSSGQDWDADTSIAINFLAKYFKISSKRTLYQLPEVNHFCDAFMIGSDQVWRENSIPLVGYSFFLDFVDNNKPKFAFSTSFGGEKFTSNEDLREIVKGLLSRFNAISVRESSGVAVCKNEFGINVEQILDPVLLCRKEKYTEIVGSLDEEIPEKFLLCYILDPNDELAEIAKEISIAENLEIITIFGMKEYERNKKIWHLGKILSKITPEQFVHYISKCTFLLTDSHHGTCFGIVFHKQYYAYVNKMRGATRFLTVAEKLGLEDRLLMSPYQLSVEENLPKINYDLVEKKLAIERKKAYRWLIAALQSDNNKAEFSLAKIIADSYRRDTYLFSKIEKLSNQITSQKDEINDLKDIIHAKSHEIESHSLNGLFSKMLQKIRRYNHFK